MARPKKDVSKLSELGRLGEKVLKRALEDIDRDYLDARKSTRAPVYSLTDLMKVIDRVQKFEFINLKLKEDDESGAFFGNQRGADNDETD